MKAKLFSSLVVMCGVYISAFAGGNVTIEHTTQRFIGDVSTFDRDKYTNAHLLHEKGNNEFETFKSDYNINPDYIGGRQFWNPLGMVKNGVIPNVTDRYNGTRKITPNLVATGTARQLMWDKNVDYSAINITTHSKNAAAFVAKKYRDDWDLIPQYLEPFNEPMVHAIDYYPEGKEGKYIDEKLKSIYDKISYYHKHLADAIRATPELKDMKVIGYASAFPEFEGNNFKSWNTRYKNFIDIAGKELDGFSIHLYDGSGINNTGGRRSGSNVEAILDLIETYSLIALDELKPYAITEYGRLVADQPGWITDKTQSNYETVENSQAVRSQLHMIMSFMERAGNIMTTIPFNVDTRDVKQKYTKSSIWINNNGAIETTNRVFLYEMLKDIKGDRVWIHSDNVDIQTQAFVSGDELYVMLNNLNDAKQTMNLNLINKDGLQHVDVKRLKIFIDKKPELTNSALSAAPASISLEYGETAVLTYKFKESIAFENTIYSTKYYSKKYLDEISAGGILAYSFMDVETGEGSAVLRLSIGRAHGLTTKPSSVMINGTKINIDSDIIRGYDQKTRKQFFGTLEIPVDIALLNNGHNKVRVTFSDKGGYVSSAILQVNKKKESTELAENDYSALKLVPSVVDAGEVVTVMNNDKPLTIYDIKGNIVASENESSTINTVNFTSGMYLVSAEGAVKKLLVR